MIQFISKISGWIYTKFSRKQFSILLLRKWQDSWRSAVRGSASAWSRFPNSKDLKSKSKTSLGSDYSDSWEPHTFLVHKTYTPVVNICIQSLCSHHGLGLDTIEKATRHICSKSSTFMSRNGGKKRRKKMLLNRFSNWRLDKLLLFHNRKKTLKLIKYLIFLMCQLGNIKYS